MENSIELNRSIFIECNWTYDTSPDERYGYSSLMYCLQKYAEKMSEQGKVIHSKVFILLAQAASMMLVASSINEPFKASFEDFQSGRRSALPADLNEEELTFFENILNDVDEPLLKARLADLLWLLRKPRKSEYAKEAIDSYISHPINDETWNRGVNDCWERAARLCIQIKDFDRLGSIKSKLFEAMFAEYPRTKFMTFWIAELLDKLKIDKDFIENIAPLLFKNAIRLKAEGDFYPARVFFDLAARKFRQCGNEDGWLESLTEVSDCFELEADSRLNDSNAVANSFYEDAIQAYRRIPTRYREKYDVNEKINLIRQKIAVSGKAALDEMGIISAPSIDISDMVNQSIEHVSGKRSTDEALMYFTGLYSGPKYKNLIESAQNSLQRSVIGRLFGSSHFSSDGRVIAKVPAINSSTGEDDHAYQAALQREIQQQLSLEIQLVVNGRIMPALSQLLKEHRFKREQVIATCRYSPIVPQGREQLLGYAIWLGFEREFGAAIHLLCPQVEHIVRTQLKECGAHTSNIDREGIENENGLSTLMELPEALSLYGEDLTFEIKSVFTDALGFNLRNAVAHGLLNDSDSLSIQSVYAWWLVLRLVVRLKKFWKLCDGIEAPSPKIGKRTA